MNGDDLLDLILGRLISTPQTLPLVLVSKLNEGVEKLEHELGLDLLVPEDLGLAPFVELGFNLNLGHVLRKLRMDLVLERLLLVNFE